MKPGLLTLFSILPILFLVAAGQSSAQTPQRDNRPRTASVSGRVTIAGKPAANAVITVEETDLKPGAGESELRIPLQVKTRTDGDGRYLAGGLAEGRYVVSAMLRAFVDAGSSGDHALSRTVSLDEGEAREKIDFALIRGGVITGKVMDDEGAPLVARRVQSYTLDEQGQKRYYQGLLYEMYETDDRGVYRIYGLPPGRYIIGAGGEGGGDMLRGGGGRFALTYHPDTTDEKQAKVIEIKEGSEVTGVDIRFGSARKTYEAAGRVVDRETGKPVPRVYVSCGPKPEKDVSSSGYSTTAIADGQGAFKLSGLPPGRYQAMIMDVLGETGYTGEAAEFEITDDNVNGLELKAFLGASVSGFVVIEGADAAAGDQLQSIVVNASVMPLSDATGDANERPSGPRFFRPARVNADGSFVLKGLQAGGVSFRVYSFSSNQLRIKRIERDGVEVKDAIEVRPGEKIAGLRIVAHRAQGRIRGQVQIAGGALPDGWRLDAHASRPASADESKSGAMTPVSIEEAGGHVSVDEKGRFVIDGLPAGEYDLLITLSMQIAGGGRTAVGWPRSNQRVTVRENAETSVTITFDPSSINRPQNQPDNQLNNQEDRR